ncbi:MurR/RpiR family transcriptional regulator [Paenibacillus wynnii]|uniref:RpiR family transcriptional regulator n=1 Tax=Paenibacillus wynnii TaxID=268407 RepID=A0A098M7Q4_9BACL|nr:MurR/RpiR family transcriptional regulator [Paenibacillus wynnii]KGE18066.1 RpiR family transcriptional regulator [Paenibacillus wynnii]
MIGSIVVQIETMLTQLPESERKAARYILDEIEGISKLSIHTLAEKAGTSAAAITRLCRSLGLSGFPDLKVRLSVENAMEQKPGYYDIERQETMQNVIQKTVSNSLQAIQDIILHLQPDTIDQVVRDFSEASVIYMYGVGASAIVAADAAQKWLRLGKPAFALQDEHLIATALASAPPNALFMGVSYSGNTKEVVQLFRVAKNYGVRTIGLSRFGNHKMSELADVMLYTPLAPEATLRSGATSSRLAQLVVIDILFFAYASTQYDETITKLGRTHEAISFLK